jgi:formyl-CoA transferase
VATNNNGPLSRFTVLDLTRARSGPTAVRQLSDWGANVIKVEELGEQDGDGSPFDKRHGPDFQNLHRNKRSLTLNLKSPEGVAVFKRMAEKADVIVENYRPKVKDRLGIDYEAFARSTRASSTPASAASVRTAPTLTGPASIRSRRA